MDTSPIELSTMTVVSKYRAGACLAFDLSCCLSAERLGQFTIFHGYIPSPQHCS